MDEPTASERSDSIARARVGPGRVLDLPSSVLRPIELSTEVIGSVDGIRALKPDYERLERASGNTLPFALREWHLAWCRHLLNRHPRREEQLHLLVLRNRSGDCVALVPLVLSRWHIGPLRLPTLGFLGEDEGVTEIRGALIEPGYEQACVRSVYEHISAVPGWRWLQWRDANEALATALTLELRPRWHEVRTDCVLDLPPSWQQFRAVLPRNVRESIRHGYNSLRRAGHAFQLVVARTPEEVVEALPRFFELHARRSCMPRVPRHRNYFANPLLQSFLSEACANLAARDAVRVFQLRVAGTIVASHLGFVVGNALTLYYSGFDPAWARYGVMTTTMTEALRYAIAEGVRTVSLSPTPVRSKLRWRPRFLELRSCVVPRGALGSRLACNAYCMAASSERLPLRLLRRMLRYPLRWN